MLWLALHCRDLALEVFAGLPAGEPCAVIEAAGESELLVACNARAQAAGLRPGMSASAAQVRVPALHGVARDREAERLALRRLADCCIGWTDYVVLEPPATVLLEIGGSLDLFGGAEAIAEQVHARAEALGHAPAQGLAPTPAAARLLARSGGGAVLDGHQLERRLAPLSWRALEPDPQVAERLAGWGLETLGECFGLPRGGLAQRLGTDFVAALDRLRGIRAETPPRFEPQARYHGLLPLPAETAELGLPLEALERLTRELEAWLRARDAGLQRFEIDLHPPRGPRTSICVGLATPGRQAGHLFEVARERLERAELPGAIGAVGLRGHRAVAYRPSAADLWSEASEEPPERLLERLRARLGHDAVRGLTLHADHRPERAWSWHPPGAAPAHEPRRPPLRPLWLLTEPALLPQDERGRPRCEGALELIDGPERIETGWWDGDDVERDYFIARNPDGVTLWVYRERRVPRTWYVQGVFS